MTYKHYHFAASVDEVVTMITQSKKNIIIGGTHWLKMGRASYNTAIDISGLGLTAIEEDSENIIIGGDASLRSLETNPLILRHCPLLAEAVKNIVGVQFRNTARIGASVYSRFGFSDVSTALLALDCHVEINGSQSIPMADYQQMPRDRHFVTRIYLRKNTAAHSYHTMRQNSNGLPYITMAVTKTEDGEWRISVGARPSRPILACETARYLTAGGTDVDEAASLLLDELTFGDNIFSSEAYRKHLVNVFFRRGVNELWN